MEYHLYSCVQESIQLLLYDNARFLCERLVACSATESNLNLLALCYYHCDQAYRAYHLLKGCAGAQSRYLFALCCVQLGKLSEAEDALLKYGELEVPNSFAGYYLLGKVCRLTNRAPQATTYFQKALKLNPFMWTAYEELCRLGADDVAQEFVTSQKKNFALGQSHSTFSYCSPPSANVVTPAPQTITPQTYFEDQRNQTQNPRTEFLQQCWTPPNNTVTPGAEPPPIAPPPMHHKAEGTVAFPGFCVLDSGTGKQTPGGQRNKVMDEGKVRKVSGKLFHEPGSNLRRSSRLAALAAQGSAHGHPSTPSNSKSQNAQPFAYSQPQPSLGQGQPPQPPPLNLHNLHDRKGLPAGPKSSPEAAQQGVTSSSGGGDYDMVGPSVECAAQTWAVMDPIYEGYRHLCMYRCREAIAAFMRVPREQYMTGWVLCHLGKAHFEVVEYSQAQQAFEAARHVDRFRLEGMEVFSTVLWHTKKEVELSHLAQELVAIDRLAPQAWCVLGNFFSLQKEHDTALQFFERALQLDPSFTYAYTLCGHEYFANEDFDKSMTCYRNAVRADGRHYNAMYGIGQIYFQQEKYDMALKHFELASSINPRSSVLHCYQGITLHKMAKFEAAIAKLQDAIMLDPHNPLARYEKAGVMLSMDRPEAALAELEALREIAPREASIFFQIGKLYKRTGQLDLALRNYCIAMDLKPSSTDVGLIKAAIEKIYINEENEEEEM